MASSPEFLDYVRDQLRSAGPISHRRMFGEYAIYYDDKVVALVCGDQLYLKPTEAGRALIGTPREAPPYPSAKPYFLVSGELDDPDLMAQLVRATARELPLPKPKPTRAPKRNPKPNPERKAPKRRAGKAKPVRRGR
jgi:TfoX/Sxy family transcriptional regulator of competence genes